MYYVLVRNLKFRAYSKINSRLGNEIILLDVVHTFLSNVLGVITYARV